MHISSRTVEEHVQKATKFLREDLKEVLFCLLFCFVNTFMQAFSGVCKKIKCKKKHFFFFLTP
mgnify:CR=1 FL=1